MVSLSVPISDYGDKLAPQILPDIKKWFCQKQSFGEKPKLRKQSGEYADICNRKGRFYFKFTKASLALSLKDVFALVGGAQWMSFSFGLIYICVLPIFPGTKVNKGIGKRIYKEFL